jgi:hypothetical protein
MYLQCRQGSLFPKEIKEIIREDFKSGEHGILYEEEIKRSEIDMVFWNAVLQRFIMKLTGIVGMTNVPVVIQNKLMVISNRGRTLNEIKKGNADVFSLWQRIPKAHTAPSARQNYVIGSLERGSPQALHFLDALRQNMTSQNQVDDASNTPQEYIDSAKWFTQRLEQTYKSYNDGTYTLPSSSATETSNQKHVKTNIANISSPPVVKYCDLCGFAAHKNLDGLCRFFHENGYKALEIANSEANGNRPFRTFSERSPQYRSLTLDRQQRMKSEVASIMKGKGLIYNGTPSIEAHIYEKALPMTENMKASNLPSQSNTNVIYKDNKPVAKLSHNLLVELTILE